MGPMSQVLCLDALHLWVDQASIKTCHALPWIPQAVAKQALSSSLPWWAMRLHDKSPEAQTDEQFKRENRRGAFADLWIRFGRVISAWYNAGSTCGDSGVRYNFQGA